MVFSLFSKREGFSQTSKTLLRKREVRETKRRCNIKGREERLSSGQSDWADERWIRTRREVRVRTKREQREWGE